MKNRFTILFALLCASVMGWAGVAQDTWIPTTAPSTEVYAEQFKWFAIPGENIEGLSVNEIQEISGEIVIYVNFSDAAFDAVEGCERLDNAGALAFLKVSSLLTQENTDIYVKNGDDVRWAFRIQNTKYSSTPASFDPTSVDWTSSENTTTYHKINDQFQIAAENAANMPTGPLNIQQPAWAAFEGIYVEVPAGVSACAFNDVAVTDGDEFDGNTGAGIVLNPAALTNEITKVTVTHGLGTTTFYVHNANAGGSDPEPAKASECFGAKGHFGTPTAKHVYYQIDYEANKAIISLLSLTGYPLDFAEVQITGVGSYAMTANGAGGYTYTINNPTVDAEWYIRFLYSDTNMPGNEMTAETQSSSDENIIFYQVGACTATVTENVNIALASEGASATASAPETGNVAANAIDGNIGTRWEAPASDPQWICVNLGARKKFNTVQLVHEGAYIKTYDIQISDDGTNFTTIKHVSETLDGFPYEQTIELGFDYAAQYLRIYGTERGTQWGYSLWELRAMYSGASVLTSITLTAADTKAIVGGAGVVLTATPKDQKGQAMEAEISYEIVPATAGHMSGSTYIPDQVGMATIRAYSASIYSPAVQVLGVTSVNLALSTNIDTDNKIIDQSVYTPDGTNAFYAVDGNMGSVWQGSPTNGTAGDDESRTYDCWFIVDLGAFYNIDLVALHFEGACSELYHIDFSENNSDWNLGYNLVGTAGTNARNDYWTDLDNNTKVRYVRFWSTKAATVWGMKMFEFEVYGTEWTSGDEEKPVMVSASLVSSTINSAVIAVSATDNDEVARYHVVDDANGIDANFTPSDGKITINGLTHNTAYNFTITAKDASNNESANLIVVPVTTPFDGSVNLALNQPCEAGYTNTNPAEQEGAANDGNDNTNWNTYADRPASEEWWYVDLGEIYTLTNITAVWGDVYSTNYILQARVEAPSTADKADDAAWVTLATVTDAAANAEKSTNVSGVGRYVRIHSLAKSANFFRLRELEVYGSGVAENDTEAPVMTSASLVSSADTYAVIAVAATDNQGIANYHVVDVGNSFAGNFVAEAGNITVTGLTGGTAYNFTITAIDFFGNESENYKSVEVTTTTHYIEPQAACPAPTWPAEQVKAIYSPTYSANCGFDNWTSGATFVDDTYGKKIATAAGWFGMVDFNLNCVNMEKLHLDIWIADNTTIGITPIWGGTEQCIIMNLTGQQWNSIDIDKTAYTGINDWSNIYQLKIEQIPNQTFWMANAYFYRETPYEDTEAPTAFTASLAAEHTYSVQINAQASDNSGAVIFTVKNGDDVVATQNAASAAATVINVTGLNAGTAYTFNVYVADEAGNALDPIAVPATTKALPAAAPTPKVYDKTVVPVFSDAIAGGPANIGLPYWGQASVSSFINLAADDKVFFARNFNFQGWDGFSIDATGMEYLHVDVYTRDINSIKITPISEGHEGVYSVTLTANEWTSVDIPLSAYEGNNIDWSAIFQFKFFDANPVGKDIFIDNVYFFKYRDPDYTRAVTEGKYGTICLPKAGVMTGAMIFEVAYLDNSVNKIFFDEVISGEMIAGRPYIFLPNESVAELGVFYTDDAEVSAGNYRGLFGSYTQEVLGTDGTNYILLNNQYCRVVNPNTSVGANRAYFKIGVEGGVPTNAVAPMPGRRRVGLAEQNTEVVTNIDNLNASETPVKVMIDGQLYILRGEKMYNANGQIVK